MRMKNNTFVLNKKRAIGDIISDGFQFVKKTYKLQLELFLVLVMPVLLLSIFIIYFIFSDLDMLNLNTSSALNDESVLKLFGSYVGILFSVFLFYFMLYSIGIKYKQNNNEVPEKAEVTGFMKENALRFIAYVGAFLGLLLVMVIFISAIAVISPFLIFLGILVFFFGFIYLLPLIFIFPMTYLEDDSSFSAAIMKTFQLIQGNWWPTFGVFVITNIIASLISYVFVIPLQMIMWFRMFSAPNSVEETASNTGSLMAMIMVVSMITGILVTAYSTSAMILKYYDLKERKFNTGLKEKIDQIGSNDSSIFENEGDF